ncbi:2'-5' RNA ligase family protein [Kitasatospora sp. NPDC088391]|uniref:2'-5' RNA ligase family protein n=1 Tax=Kitasatospora sp. NPDC088391 TaxID=3364074 RepID=UPI0038155AA1
MAEFRAGQTGLVVQVPEAEAAVACLREEYDPGARAGVPAHVTLHFPFLDAAAVDGPVLAALRALFAGHRAFDVRFAACGRFPGLLYLAPDPDGPLRALMAALAARWPEVPPFGGRFTELVPHLTVAHHPDPARLDLIEAALAPRLPVTTRITAAHLLTHDGTRWQRGASFPLHP